MAERKRRYIIEFKDIPTERKKVPELPVKERVKNFSEVELGYDREQAVAEAIRCLSCRRCIGCGLCLAVCHPKAIDYNQADSEVELEAESIIITPGVDRVTSAIDEKFGYGKYPNVVTSPEFERILSDNGPYKGLVLRPYDGEIPRRIAFVPSDAGDTHLLTYAIKAVLAAQQKVRDVETHLFFPDAEVHKAEIKKYLGKESRIGVGSGEVLAITENEENRNLIIESSENGSTRKEEFELVVLLTNYQFPEEVKKLAQTLGMDLGSNKFRDTTDTSLVKTAKEGIFLSGLALL